MANKHHPLFREYSGAEWLLTKMLWLNCFSGFECSWFYDPCGPFLCVLQCNSSILFINETFKKHL